MPLLHVFQNVEAPARSAPAGATTSENAVTRGSSPEATSEDPIVLVFAADEQFAMPLAVALYSALVNLRRSSRAVVYIIDGGMESASRKRLQNVIARAHSRAHVEFVTPGPERLKAYTLRVEGRFSPSVFLRLLIPELLPGCYEKAIYLDSDLVVEKDLMDLWNAGIGELPLLAVHERDVASPYGLHNWRELGLASNAPFFNSGVLVMNLRRWRDEHITEDVLSYLARHREELNLPHEQEGLNAVLAGRWGMVDMRWNLTYPFFNVQRFENLPFADELRDHRQLFARDPYIVHFNAADKPWHANCLHPARNRFYTYLKRSGWFGPAEYVGWRARLLPAQVASILGSLAKEQARRVTKSKSPRPDSGPCDRNDVPRDHADSGVVLAFAADEAFAMPLAVTVYSALVNLSAERVAVFVLDGGIGGESRRRILNVASRAHRDAEVTFVRPETARLNAYTLKMEGRFSKSIFLRLLIAELLPAEIRRAIYLDSDMIVEGDLTRLWNIEMGDHALLAVQDFAIPRVSSTPRGLYNWRELGLAHDAPYFNSGLLVLNLQRWREEGIGEEILSYLSTHRDRLNVHGNQEGFNAVLSGRWGKLDAHWNVIHHVYDAVLFKQSEGGRHLGLSRRGLVRHARVIHFTARRKPWEPSCIHPERNRFFRYLKESGWFTLDDYLRWRMHLMPRQAASSFRYFCKSRIRMVRDMVFPRRVNAVSDRAPESSNV